MVDVLHCCIDALAQFIDVNRFNNTVQGHLRDMSTVLELYKASQIKILPKEPVLDKIESWSTCYLKEKFSMDAIRRLDAISEEVIIWSEASKD